MNGLNHGFSMCLYMWIFSLHGFCMIFFFRPLFVQGIVFQVHPCSFLCTNVFSWLFFFGFSPPHLHHFSNCPSQRRQERLFSYKVAPVSGWDVCLLLGAIPAQISLFLLIVPPLLTLYNSCHVDCGFHRVSSQTSDLGASSFVVFLAFLFVARQFVQIEQPFSNFILFSM